MTISMRILEDADGLGIRGLVSVEVSCNPAPQNGATLFINNVMYAQDTVGRKLYSFKWDTTKYPDGTHILRAEAQYSKRKSTSQFAVTTANSALEEVTIFPSNTVYPKVA